MERRGHRQIEHTADIAVQFWAPTEEDALAEGARALISMLTSGQAVPASGQRHVAVKATDPEDRLVRWLNEVLFLAVVEGFLLAGARITLRGDDVLEAEVWGEEDAAAKITDELKAVTYHDVRLAREGVRVVGHVVIDV